MTDKEANISDKQTGEEAGTEEKPLTFLEILNSIFAAAIGVQSQKQRVRDFSRGKPIQFIMAGFVFAGIFVLVLVFAVRLVLSLV